MCFWSPREKSGASLRHERAGRIDLTEQNVSLLKSGKVRGIRFDTLSKIRPPLGCQPGDRLENQPDTEMARSEVK